MPVQKCESNGKQGRKWGSSGKCYPCKRTGDGWDCKEATKKALAQAAAMGELPGTGKAQEIEDLAKVVEDHFAKNFWSGLI